MELLRPYQEFSCTWCSGDQALASINVTIEADAAFLAKAVAAVLTFQWRRRETAEWTQARQCAPIAWTAAPDHGSYALKIPEMGVLWPPCYKVVHRRQSSLRLPSVPSLGICISK